MLAGLQPSQQLESDMSPSRNPKNDPGSDNQALKSDLSRR